MRRSNRINSRIILRTILILVVGGIVVFAAYLAMENFYQEEEIAHAGQTLTDYNELKAIYINGQKYLPNPDIYTFFLGGVDKFGEVAETDSYKNNEQVDFLSVIAYDTEKNTCKILIINRDTMTDVQVLGLGGRVAGTSTEQIALSHTYGTGMKDSAENTIEAVETLLGGINIDNYAIMKMDAIPILTDMVGGVTVTMTEDLTSIDPSFTAGTTANLTGDLALKFVRQRYYVSDGSNLARIGRQQQFIDGFYNNLKHNVDANNSFLVEAFGAVEDYMVTNCDYVQMNEFQNYVKTYPEATVFTIPGEAKLGEVYMEYYPDQAGLDQLTVDLFYQPAEK